MPRIRAYQAEDQERLEACIVWCLAFGLGMGVIPTTNNLWLVVSQWPLFSNHRPVLGEGARLFLLGFMLYLCVGLVTVLVSWFITCIVLDEARRRANTPTHPRNRTPGEAGNGWFTSERAYKDQNPCKQTKALKANNW